MVLYFFNKIEFYVGFRYEYHSYSPWKFQTVGLIHERDRKNISWSRLASLYFRSPHFLTRQTIFIHRTTRQRRPPAFAHYTSAVIPLLLHSTNSTPQSCSLRSHLIVIRTMAPTTTMKRPATPVVGGAEGTEVPIFLQSECKK